MYRLLQDCALSLWRTTQQCGPEPRAQRSSCFATSLVPNHPRAHQSTHGAWRTQEHAIARWRQRQRPAAAAATQVEQTSRERTLAEFASAGWARKEAKVKLRGRSSAVKYNLSFGQKRIEIFLAEAQPDECKAEAT